ncbi:uncharacterized protein LOC128273075 [Anopheles cruzii]|uniref:uncharacterized protein LOC128273075 n=1 Tax=Anopheles cruzii TaxID=68878 RepID=UPI0022EC1F2B|nr:uncharacterized protein LOC128273075 [Anopheles cruzii]
MVEESFKIVPVCSQLVDGGMEAPKVLMQECVQFLKVIHQYLCGEDPYNASEVVKCDDSKGHPQPSELGNRIYLNLLPDDSREVTRATLKAQCAGLLGRIEKSVRLITAPSAAPKCPPDQQQEEEEEGAYLDMSGSNTPKANIGSSSASIDDTMEDVEATQDSVDGPTLQESHENTYELTTDQILYDECQQDVTCGEVSPPLKTAESVTDEHQCPFGGLPASHLRLVPSVAKHGTLFKQEKRLFFDQFKKYYVGLIGKWLLVYNSHNDLKPCQTIYIKSFKLDLSLNEHINEKHLFQIYTHTDSKVHFLSPSFQDLNEWIVAIENNLIERTDRIEGTSSNAVRKLPLPPYPEQCGTDETDLHTMSHYDGIYEEPSLCLKTEVESPAKENGGSANTHGYDTPKPGPPKPVEPDVVPDVGKTDPPSMGKKNDSLVTSSDSCSVNAAIPQLTPSTNTPVKSWLKNRFNRSPAEPVDVKPSKKAMKKLSFEELPSSDGAKEPKPTGTAKQLPSQAPPKLTLTTTPLNKGAKINMIISQLEANGQLNLLSKRLNQSNKRYTWVVDDVVTG